MEAARLREARRGARGAGRGGKPGGASGSRSLAQVPEGKAEARLPSGQRRAPFIHYLPGIWAPKGWEREMLAEVAASPAGEDGG